MTIMFEAIAATVILTEETAKLTLGQKLQVLLPHQVRAILETKGYLRLTGE